MTSCRVTFFLAALADDAGLRQQELGFARALSERGQDVSILSYFRPVVSEAAGVPVEMILPTRFHGALHDGALSWFVVGRVLRALRELAPDAVVVSEPREAQLALRYRDKSGCAVVYRVDTLDGLALPESSGPGVPNHGASHNGRVPEVVDLLHRADRVLAPSDFVRAALAEADVDARVLPIGVDASRFHPGCRVPGVRITMPQILFLGTYDPGGGAFEVVQAVHRVLETCPDTVLQMHGRASSAQHVERITQYVAEHGLDERVLVFGPIDRSELPYRMTQASVFIDGSSGGTLGSHLLEAQACGLSCVAFRDGGSGEIVEHEDTGLLAAPGDIAALAAALERLLCDDSLRVALSRAASDRAQRFTFEHLAPALERSLDEVARRRDRVGSVA